MEFRVISIGALAAHPLWGERSAVRTGHATTTLVRSGKATILVDPGLPAAALLARLKERANLDPTDITHVFLTSFRPDVRRSLEAFDRAAWMISEPEREAVGVRLVAALREAADRGEQEMREAMERDVALLQRCRPAPDALAERVDLFPLPGVSPGTCGLLLAEARHTTLICGDAIPTTEHLDQGAVLPNAADPALARRSFGDAVEIADLLVLGRDNVVVNPTRKPF